MHSTIPKTTAFVSENVKATASRYFLYLEFPAAILQTPNFDKDRPNSLNFGAIGSVIGHEITHAFDDLASQYGNWSEKSIEEYESKVKCIVDQYSDFRVNEVEEYLAENEEIFEEFKLRGNLTKKEDIADNGGVKLSYFAYQKFAIENPASNIVPTGLQNFTTNELFFISYAQTFCRFVKSQEIKLLFIINFLSQCRTSKANEEQSGKR